MKQFNRIIILSIFLYLLLAAGIWYALDREESTLGGLYKVEINRLLSSISEGEPDLSTCEYVKRITWLSELGNKEKAKAFFEEDNQWKMLVYPLFTDGEVSGFIRFDYKEPEYDISRIRLTAEAGLGILAGFLLGIQIYLKQKLIKPFLRMSRVPYDLAKGHLKGEVKEEKSRYFGNFLWGIGQLKDTLEVSRKRSLTLEREKKQMLMSLSHDIKTPLNTIKLYGKALEEGLYDSDEEYMHAAHQIGVKAEAIEHYVGEIMRTSREDILDIQVENGEFYLADLINRVLDTYTEKCAVRLADLKIGPYENRLLRGDLDRVLEVIENIFENAFKYGDGRRIELTFYEEDYCQLIRIYNTGEAVTDQEWNHIFESFFRGGNSEGQQGSGLGLYICREMMQKMDGEIFAEKDEDGMGFVLVFR